MSRVAGLDTPGGLSLVGVNGLSWLEAKVGTGTFRFTIAYDQGGDAVDLGLVPTESVEAAKRATGNRKAMVRAMGIAPETVTIVDQVHGGTLRPVLPGEASTGFVPATRPPYSADGLVTTDEDAVLAVSVADCAAIAISGTKGRALLHCGWRGLGTDMIERAVETVDGLEAFVGPCIGPCCFEVGPEVAERLTVDRTTQGTIDIPGIATDRLIAAGIREVRSSDLCTSCSSQSFFSFRRQGESAGRQMAFFSVP